jgi:5-methylcytosine-specific restriction enzyme A
MTDSRRRLPPLRRTGMPQAPDWSLRVPTRSSRDAGPSAKLRRLVFARAFGCCESCGTSVIGRPYTIAPRADRAAGGFSRPGVNALWNLSLLCGSAASPGGCHLLCEQRDQDMHDRGIWLWSGEDPRLVPVLLVDPQGRRMPVWLNDEGTYDYEAPALPGRHHHASWRRTTANATATSPAASARKMAVSRDWNAQ